MENTTTKLLSYRTLLTLSASETCGQVNSEGGIKKNKLNSWLSFNIIFACLGYTADACLTHYDYVRSYKGLFFVSMKYSSYSIGFLFWC